MEGVPTEFDYFAEQTISSAIEEEYDVAIPAKTVRRAGPLEFTIPAGDQVYRDLNNSLLEITCKVTQADGANLEADAAVAPVNLLLHALIKSADIQLNGTRVNDPSDLYAERAYLETVMSHTENVLKTRGAAEGWEKDDMSRMNRILLAAANNVEPNGGFVKRARWCAQSRQLTLTGRLHSDLFHQPLDIPAGIQIDVKLALNKDEKVLMAAANATFKVDILAARLLVRTKKLTPSLILAHQRMHSKMRYRIPYTRVSMKTVVLPTGSRALAENDFITGPMPSRVAICFVTSTSQSGTYNENPFNFQNFSLTNLWLKVNDRTVPHEPLAMNYTTHDYNCAYLNTLASLGMDQGDRALAITREEWASGCNVYVFKLTPGEIGTGVFHATNAGAAHISVNATFGAATTAPVTVIAYVEQPSLLEIDESNKPVV